MNKNEILQRVNDIFKDAFDNDDLIINYSTTANDIDGWDSLMQMSLIKMIEDEFNISFSIDEVIEMENVESIIDLIVNKK